MNFLPLGFQEVCRAIEAGREIRGTRCCLVILLTMACVPGSRFARYGKG
jgi:hypothetical protein